MAEGSNNSDDFGALGSFVIIIILILLVFLIITGLTTVGEFAGFGPVTFASTDPKRPFAVLPVAAVTLILLFIVFLGFIWIGREALASMKAEAQQKVLQAAESKHSETAEALAETAQQLADLQAQIPIMRQKFRTEVELEWQRDTQVEIQQAHARYLSYVDRNRVAQAQYEVAKRQRAHRLLQLEEFVAGAYPDFAQRTDPTGIKGPEVVGAAFRKHITKKVPDAGILRYSQDEEVLAMLGPLTDFPPSPPPIMPPILIPIPEMLRRRFEDMQVHV